MNIVTTHVSPEVSLFLVAVTYACAESPVLLPVHGSVFFRSHVLMVLGAGRMVDPDSVKVGFISCKCSYVVSQRNFLSVTLLLKSTTGLLKSDKNHLKWFSMLPCVFCMYVV